MERSKQAAKMVPEDLITYDEAAKKVGRHVGSMYSAIRSGRVQTYGELKGRKAVSLSEVAAWSASATRRSSPGKLVKRHPSSVVENPRVDELRDLIADVVHAMVDLGYEQLTISSDGDVQVGRWISEKFE